MEGFLDNIDIAKSLFKKRNYKETIDICIDLLADNKNDVEALKLIGKSLFAMKRIKDARIYFKKIVNIQADDYESITDLGNTYLLLDEPLSARDHYKKALSINNNYSPALINLGSIELNSGNKKEAIILLIKATKADPKSAAAWSNIGQCYYQLGELKDAEKSLKKSININPNIFNSYFLLSNILISQKKLIESEYYLRTAIDLKPDFFQGYLHLAAILKELGKLREAEIFCLKAIDLNPSIFNSYFLLSGILIAQNKLLEAEKPLLKTIELKPDLFQAHSSLGGLLAKTGRIQEAKTSTLKAIELNSDFAEGYSNLGSILKDLGNFEEAKKSVLRAIEIRPDFAEAYLNLGTIFKELGKLKEAEKSTRKAIEYKSNYAEAYYNLGNILRDLGNYKEAEIFTCKAIEVRPDYKEAYLNLGPILKTLGKLDDALISQRKAIELKPDFAAAYNNLGNIFKDLGRLKEARQAYKKSLEIEPQEVPRLANLIYTLSRLCVWDEIENYLPSLNKLGIEGQAADPLTFLYLEDNPLNHLKRSINYSRSNFKEEIPIIRYQKNKKINIGYFSSDFRNHPVTHLLIRILELHNKSEFEIYAYSLSAIEDEYTDRVKNAVSIFRDVNNLSDHEIVKLARDDRIDIAIDLNGYTNYARTSIFLYKVAPIQINYLGYTGTLGSKSFDYIIADKMIIPEENKKFYTEKVLYLPDTCFPYDDKRPQSNRKFRKEELGLPTDGFIFTCFNSIQKITRKEFNIWISLLKKIDKSVLWIVKPDEVAMDNLYTELTNNGLCKERIVFAEKMKLDEHYSRHSCGDLFLDTFNFNAATTAGIALSSGLPLITLLGNSYSSRIAASILNSCNLSELITYSYEEYENLAYDLATNKTKLDNIREKLMDKKKSPYFDSYKFTEALESIYSNIILD